MDRGWRTKAVSDPVNTCSEQEEPQPRNPDLLTEYALVQRLAANPAPFDLHVGF